MYAARVRFRLLGVLVVIVALVGCQSMPSGGSSKSGMRGGSGQVDSRLRDNHSARFFSRSGWTACLGATAGAILTCQLSNASNKQECMVAAGIVACGIGLGVNYYLDHQRAKYANNEQRLDAHIADVRKDNQQLRQLTQTAHEVIADDRAKIERLQQQIDANEIESDKARREIASIDANTTFLRKTLEDTKKRKQHWQEVANAEQADGAHIDTLNAEIHDMQNQIVALETEIDDLYAQRQSIRLG